MDQIPQSTPNASVPLTDPLQTPLPPLGTQSPTTPEPLATPPNPPSNSKFRFIILGLAVLVLVVLGIAYTVLLRSAATPNEEPIVQKPIVKIAVNPWKASELNAMIAKILLEEKLGYTVELVDIDELSQWESLAQGEVHATLEIWPSGHTENIQKYIEQDKTVEFGGLLGPVGKIGWFIPRYLLDQHPQLATWQGLTKPENVALFATTPSGKGQFLTGDPTWTQYDQQIIQNLKLNFEVKSLGSEQALINAVEDAYQNKKPIIFYFWTPHWAHSLYDLAPVGLPPHTSQCYEDLENGVNCDYPADKLQKAYWSGFKDYAPQAHQFLKKFNYSNQDQIGMLAAVQLNQQSVEEVARKWIKNNDTIWIHWLP